MFYPVTDDDIPVLSVPSRDAFKRDQAAWFDSEANSRWETIRPHGAPAFHRHLLEWKFERATAPVASGLRGASVLVVCGGSGMDAEFLARRGANVISSDISTGASRRALKRAALYDLPIEPVVADAERLPFADRSIDVVYVHDGLHHLERPMNGVAEMMRIARLAICITEPADAAVTHLAVRLGLAESREEAGNQVRRLELPELCAALRLGNFSIASSGRYAMYYSHEPGIPSRLLSLPGVLHASDAAFRFSNSMMGRWGNKLSVVAVRT
jgi:SAM-dependent methyltransferase